MNRPRRCLLLICGIGIASCAGSGRVVKLYEAPNVDRESSAYSRILVVAVHENRDVRRRFEESVARELADRQTEAVASIAAMGSDEPINRDTLVAVARDERADAVMITRLIGVDVSSEVKAGRTTIEPQRRSDLPLVDAFRYDYAETADPMTITTQRTVKVTSDLYDAMTEARVWSVESTAFAKETVDDVIDTLSAAIAKQLAKDGLVR